MTRLALAAAAAIVASLAWSGAHAESRTTIEISTILASRDNGNFDARLASLRPQLKQMRFRTVRLLNKDIRALHGVGGQVGMDLPGRRYLHITTREHTPDHLRLHILLNEDNHPVVNTDVKLCHGSPVVIGGPRDDAGVLVIAIAARDWRPEDDEPHAAPSQGGGRDVSPKGKDPASRELAPMAPAAPSPAVSAVAPVPPQN